MPSATVTAAATDAAPRYGDIGDALAGIPLGDRSWRQWWLAMAAALALTGILAVSLGVLFWDGTAIWGNAMPVTWALDIVSYDWWIGIACGGLLVSAMVLLLDQGSRGALNRIGETMALLAAASAAIYPIIHLGRPWFFYWTLPYPNSFALWPQFRSPLVWDAFDIIAFLGLASGLWFVGLLPDLASLRDGALTQARAGRGGRGLLRAQLYGIAALGWRGSAAHWHRWVQAYRILAALGVLVVVALQTGASVMFAGSLEPGWHDTLLPMTDLASAMFAGVGVLSVITVVLRRAFALEALITSRHLRALASLLLGLCLVDIYCQAAGAFTVSLSADRFARAVALRRMVGPVAWSFWMLVSAALLPPLLLLSARLRQSPRALAWIGGGVAAGVWGDHYTLIVATLQHDFLPTVAHATRITVFGWSTFAGSAGIFLLLMLLFLRLLPIVSLVGTRSAAPAVSRSGVGIRPSRTAARSPDDAPIWGIAAEFATAEDAAAAVRALRAGCELRVESYSPIPSRQLAAALGLSTGAMGWFAAAAFVIVAGLVFAMCVYAAGYGYVFDIGGRPSFGWQAYIVPSASSGCLGAGMAVVAALLVLNRLPRLNHPAFNIPGIERASADRFFVAAHGHEDAVDTDAAETVLCGLPALSLHRVPR